ncbi:hypothetical protein JCM15124A_00440 [Prevotella falsenii]
MLNFKEKEMKRFSFYMHCLKEGLLRVWRNKFNMKGCCPRSDYWWSMAGLWGIILLTAFFPPISILVFTATIPLTVQRLHDTGKNGSWLAGALAVIFTTRIAARLLGACLPATIAMTCISVMALCGLVYLLCQGSIPNTVNS